MTKSIRPNQMVRPQQKLTLSFGKTLQNYINMEILPLKIIPNRTRNQYYYHKVQRPCLKMDIQIF